jgi:ATP-binding cassette subfamily C protein
MLQVYDRVLPSRSVSTLIGLTALAAFLYIAQGFLDIVRGRLLLRIGRSFDESLSPRVFALIAHLPLARRNGEGTQPLRDLDQIKGFLASSGPVAFYDLPWMPVYLAVCFVFHPLIGYAALFGAVVLAFVTLLTEALTRQPMKVASVNATGRANLAEASRRNAEVLAAMGMTKRVGIIWQEANTKHLDAHQRANDVAGGLGGFQDRRRLSSPACSASAPTSSSTARRRVASSSPARFCPLVPSRRLISSSQTGKASSPPGRDGAASTTCWRPTQSASGACRFARPSRLLLSRTLP